MQPFDRFTERAKRVLTIAQREAEAAEQSYIGTEHILLGLMLEGTGVAAMALRRFGVSLRRTREAIAAVLEASPPILVQTVVPTSRTRRVIEVAFEEARGMGHGHVGTEHLLLGLLVEGEGVAARVLVDMGVTLEKAREQIARLLSAAVVEPPGPRALPMPSPAVRELMNRAQSRAGRAGSSAVDLQHLLMEAGAEDAGIEALARLLDVRRAAAQKRQALAAQDYETAARHQAEELRAQQALDRAIAAWRDELGPAARQTSG
jgi:ATP-dependent Clp protease ATP-binding subunit ClpA